MAFSYRRTVCVLLVAASAAAGERAASPADATVFVRVVGNLRARQSEFGPVVVPDRDGVEIASGTGFVVSPLGHILTNHHVIADRELTLGDPVRRITVSLTVTRIEVCFPQAVVSAAVVPTQCLAATVSGVDPDLDLAALTVGASNLPYVALGDSDAVETGHAVRALGYPLGRATEVGLPDARSVVPGVSVNAGTISAVRADGRGERRLLQTDATVNPGNSGGPLVNRAGFAVGVIRSRLADATNIGFAIAINDAKDFLESRGLGGLLPAQRIRLGGVNRLEVKRLSIRLPEGGADASPFLTRVEMEPRIVDAEVRVDRVRSTWPLSQLEERLVTGTLFEPFVASSHESQPVPSSSSRLGSALAGAPGTPLDVAMLYRVIELGGERIVARVVGPSEHIAFNERVFRDALTSLDVQRMEVPAIDVGALQWATAATEAGNAPGLPVPSGWVVEASAPIICPGLPEPQLAGSASWPADPAVSLRVAVWQAGSFDPAQGARACVPRTVAAAGATAYSRREDVMGVPIVVEGAFARLADGRLAQVEGRAPTARGPAARQLVEAWLARTAGRSTNRPAD